MTMRDGIVLAGLILALVVFAYPFVLFPVLLKLAVRRPAEGSRSIGPAEPPDGWPELTLLLCALNEERVIGSKLENAVGLDYPPDRLRVVVVNDGSTDNTRAIADRFVGRGIEVIHREQRRGKVANLNAVVPRLETPYVVLSDANVIYDRQSLKWLASRLVEPGVGGVSGKVILCETSEEFASAESGYYSVEWTLQELGSTLHSMVGSDGAMYGFRRELFTVCPDDTLIEDFVVALGIVRQGWRMVMEPRALAWEEGPQSLAEEWKRKVRIAAGAAQALLRGNGWPWGAPARFWFLFISHKLLRWLAPLSGMAALVLAGLAWPHPLAMLVLGGVATLALLAALRWVTGWTAVWLNVPFYFLFGQLAVLIGLWKGITGTQKVLWAKANR